MSVYVVTLAEMKSSVGITDTDDDAAVTLLLEGLQGRFDGECGRRFLFAEGETDIFDGGVSALELRRWPVTTVTSIHVSADQEWDSDSLLESDDYRINTARGLIVYGVGTYRWASGVQNVRVVYDGGFVKSDGSAATGVDANALEALRRAMLMQAGFEWRNRNTLGQQSVSMQGASVNLSPAKLLPEVKEILRGLARL